ncbi:hypothetical protein [Nocardia salmonicida]|uniref:hypothetical protein n=1 Tax=Nocardia salmonicida TaxID=53431 RepID=UPI0007A518DD|nr:hypothetical protein [Nocardia salmonicida]
MTTTVGISAERTVVRGVLLSNAPGKRPEVLQAVEQWVADGGSIVGVLDALTEASPVVADVAVAYHSAEDRHRIVSQLADGQWRASSLVSTRSALFALVGDMPELAEFETVVLLNLADRTATAVVVGPDRRQILASDTWTTGFADGTSLDGPVDAFDADAMTEAIAHVRSMLESIPTHPGAVALCGSSAADPEIAGALRYALTARVVLVPDFAEATARGAALIAADQVRQQSAEPPRAPRRPKRLLLAAAALAAFLGVSGFAVAQVLDDNTPTTNAGSLDTTSPSPSSTPTTVEAPLPTSSQPPAQPAPPLAPAPDPGVPSAAAPAPPSAATAPTAPRGPKPPTRVPAPEDGPTDSSAPPSSPEAAAPSAPPTPTKVGPPGPQGLFPGESPPPAAGSDPAAEQAWWANHWNLKRQWMNGG